MREQLAEYAHKSWAGWMEYLFSRSHQVSDGSVVIPPELANRWKRQVNTPFADLSEKEKASDYAEADKILAILKQRPPALALNIRHSAGAFIFDCSCGYEDLRIGPTSPLVRCPQCLDSHTYTPVYTGGSPGYQPGGVSGK